MRLSPGERERVLLAVADERSSIAALIDGLDPEQLATPMIGGPPVYISWHRT